MVARGAAMSASSEGLRNLEVARTLQVALETRHISLLREVLDEDVRWDGPNDGPTTRHGREQVERRLAEQANEGVTVFVDQTEAMGSDVVVFASGVSRGMGEGWTRKNVHYWRLREKAEDPLASSCAASCPFCGYRMLSKAQPGSAVWADAGIGNGAIRADVRRSHRFCPATRAWGMRECTSATLTDTFCALAATATTRTDADHRVRGASTLRLLPDAFAVGLATRQIQVRQQ
ncbi:MAG: hypothetical protein NVSMB2_11920 [Chloroflexota bacterium]